jgi:tRNA-dihydrouridine synthase
MTTDIQTYLHNPEVFQQVVQAAMTGDTTVMPTVKAILDAAPEWAQALGNLTQHAENKCLYKINFIFFTKILDYLFDISDQMSKADIRPKFDPLILHKTP